MQQPTALIERILNDAQRNSTFKAFGRLSVDERMEMMHWADEVQEIMTGILDPPAGTKQEKPFEQSKGMSDIDLIMRLATLSSESPTGGQSRELEIIVRQLESRLDALEHQADNTAVDLDILRRFGR